MKKLSKNGVWAGAFFFLFVVVAWTMQPPPPPLNLANLKKLVSQADVVLVGRVVSVKKALKPDQPTLKEIEVSVEIKRLLKGKAPGSTITVREDIPVRKNIQVKGNPKVVGVRIGPTPYHGVYELGDNVVLILVKSEGREDEYQPIGSGSYDKYFGEFLIRGGRIKPLYYRFSDDIEKYTRSEGEFISLVENILKRRNDG